MLFNSLDFAVFLPLVFGVYWLLPKSRRFQNAWLLFASYVFYGWWDYRFLSLIVLSTVVDFFLGRALDGEDRKAKRRLYAGMSLVLNLGLLGFFKYFNFFQENFVEAFRFFGHEITGWDLKIILPVGISFYTFQTLSYTLDIYHGKLKPSRSFLDFATFVAFFPQLVAGPIERAKAFLPQVARPRTFSYENAREGVQLMVFGFFRKMVVADQMAFYVDKVWERLDAANIFILILASIFFSVQIYMDFSGYSRIARGLAKLLGMELMVNFNYPYKSRSFGEFWSRWHISLSSWFRDYVYIPLGGNRRGEGRTYWNLFVVFATSGLWHGASWNFIIWGVMHWALIAMERFLGDTLHFKIPRWLKHWVVLFMVNITWIFFRAPDMTTAVAFFKQLKVMPTFFGIDTFTFQSPLLLALMLFLVGTMPIWLRIERNFDKFSPKWRPLYLTFLVAFTMLFYSQGGAFIYFQF